MEIYKTKDGQTTKYIHDDGSETAIKTISSCNNTINPFTGDIVSIAKSRNKYVVFVSGSVGCFVGCKFCYLTVKKCPYIKLNSSQVIQNLKEAITNELNDRLELKGKYIKLSWMGMGDPFHNTELVKEVTLEILNWVFESNFSVGLDGVDISTTFPPKSGKKLENLKELNNLLENFKLNPEHSCDRSRLRIFYSLHSTFNKLRRSLIPYTVDIDSAICILKEFCELNDINLIFHQFFLEGINDAEIDINNLIEFMRYGDGSDCELRVLRFNNCVGSEFKESEMLDQITKILAREVDFLKYQISVGSEIKSACGQFMLSKII